MLNKENLSKYFKSENFFNRELSWLEFNRRVLKEALNNSLPLLERIKFISIFFSNLDEFYMIRVSGIKSQLRARFTEPTIDGLTPLQEIKKIESEVEKMLNEIFNCWEETIIPELNENKISISSYSDLPESEKIKLTEYFHKEIYPVLTPLAFDPGRPFPYISNLSLSFAILVKKPSGEKHFARVKIPNILPRLLRVDKIINLNVENNGSTPTVKYIWLDDLIKQNLHILFPGVEVVQSHKFRITRDTDIEIQEDEADDLLETIEENIRQRRFGSVVRLEVEKDMPEFMIETLTENLEIKSHDVQISTGQLGLSAIMMLTKHTDSTLKDKPFQSYKLTLSDDDENIFNKINTKDLFMHHPYDSFSPVTELIQTASKDPDVLAIKQTLYRVGSNSPIVQALIEAADRGKQVAVLVELKARFDEENNIYWAKELEKAGVHVVYGLVGLKTHCKMTLIVRKETEGVKRYVHLGTGNYNPTTARLYTDFGLITAHKEISADVADIFNYLTGYSEQNKHRRLYVSPINTRDTFISLIEKEIENVEAGGEGRIIFKVNSLVDPLIIAALYEASKSGVKIDLIVRGICCLVPQKVGLSENIKVISIVGRFLEHSRVYYFYNNGDEEVYLSSADLMQRNLDRRVETTFPILDKDHKNKIINDVLKCSLLDNVKSSILLPNGRYVNNHRVYNEEKINLQDILLSKINKSISVL